jgi:hypothetical protein
LDAFRRELRKKFDSKCDLLTLLNIRSNRSSRVQEDKLATGLARIWKLLAGRFFALRVFAGISNFTDRIKRVFGTF